MTDTQSTPRAELVLVDRPSPGVAVVTLNRPQKHNALTFELVELLGRRLTELADDPDLRALVLTGAGEKAFTAGIDLSEIDSGAFTLEQIHPLSRFPHPVIGAINGVAVTGGLEVALSCDFRIASTHARFADTHSRVGVTPAWGLTARLPGAVGDQWARQMSFTGDFVDAETALRIGLVNEVHEPERLLPRAIEIGTAIGSTTRSTLDRIRSIYDTVRDGSLGDALRIEGEIAAAGFEMADPEAFAQRREQVFQRVRGQ
jgi:enoyl-CoA hydratase